MSLINLESFFKLNMFNNNYLNAKNFTINLRKIEQSILCTQKEIHIASKKCNISKVHNMQTHFLNNTDYWILFIKRIVKQITKYLLINSYYSCKLLIYIYLSINLKKTKSVFLNYIKEKTEQDLVFMLLEPEWSARYEPFTYVRKSKIQFSKLQNKINKLFRHLSRSQKYIEKLYIDVYHNSKYVNSHTSTKKIQNTKLISDKLNIWLNSNTSLKHYHKDTYIQRIDLYNINNKLYKLLELIVYIGIEWQIYINLKTEILYAQLSAIDEKEIFFVKNFSLSHLKTSVAVFLKDLDIDLNLIKYEREKIFNHKLILKEAIVCAKYNDISIVKASNSSIKILFSKIRSILYRKNSINQWRLKTYLASADAKLGIQKVLFSWCSSYNNIIDDTQIFKIDRMLKNIFVSWQLKK